MSCNKFWDRQIGMDLLLQQIAPLDLAGRVQVVPAGHLLQTIENEVFARIFSIHLCFK